MVNELNEVVTTTEWDISNKSAPGVRVGVECFALSLVVRQAERAEASDSKGMSRRDERTAKPVAER